MMAHRFKNINISEVTIKNYTDLLSESLIKQVKDFIPPYGSFNDSILKRYLDNIKNTNLNRTGFI